jgi:thiamine pyrophosphate-dependent acetolactate synthase large subunit-like protein
MQVHDAVASTVVKCGVTTLFGVIGDANLLYLTDLIAKHSVRYAAAADERNAVLMASGYSQAGNRVGVATITHGPALTHAATSLTEAARAAAPLVIITGETPQVHGHPQEVDIRAVATLTGTGYQRVNSRTASGDTARAFRRAWAESRPIILDVPFDMLGLDAGDVVADWQQPINQLTPPDPAALDEALGAALGASRPLILAGRGAVHADAHDALVELADYLGAPLATSLLAKDYFRGHRLNLGVSGTVSTRLASERIASSDCVLAFGASLNRYTADSGELLGGKRVVQVDLDRSHIGTFTPVDFPVIGDARVVAEAMLGRLTESGLKPPTRRSSQLEEALSSYSPLEEFTDRSSAETIDLRTAIITLDRILPARRNVVTDCGRSLTAPWRYLHVDHPYGFVHTMNFASIGLGLGTAIGVATSRPDRPTVAAIGDGGFMQGVAELQTAVANNLPLIVVVANDGAYGAEWLKLENHGIDPNYCRSNWADLVGIAEAFGAKGYGVRSVEDLNKLEPVLAEVTSPILIDLHLDPSINTRAPIR